MTRTHTTAAFALAAVLGLTACETPMLTDPSDPRARTKDSAVAGAVLGGLFGKLTGGDTSDVVKGAILGGAAGAAIGYSLDKQAEELRRDIGNGDVEIINTGEELIVRMPQDILFAFDSDRVRSDLRRDLGVLADSLFRYPDSVVDVVGHTDNIGSDSYNDALSRRRASAVASILMDEGVRSSRLRIIGRGRFDPVASNSTASGRSQNRRVEIIIRPTG
jgi:outer membrane protein OmpA-like peptidoglycan-associated protein